jgi:cytoskeletal protein RodZ
MTVHRRSSAKRSSVPGSQSSASGPLPAVPGTGPTVRSPGGHLPLRIMLAGLLGIAAALLVACGSSGKGLIPAANAGPLQSDFEAVAQAAQSGEGNCTATEAAIEKTESDFADLPSTVDAGLRKTLSLGIANLRHRALALCVEPLPQATSTTKTSPPTTTTNTQTTPTTTTHTETTTTPTTPTATTPTATTPGGGTPAPGSESAPGASSGPGGGTGIGGESGAGAGGAGESGAPGAGAGQESGK